MSYRILFSESDVEALGWIASWPKVPGDWKCEFFTLGVVGTDGDRLTLYLTPEGVERVRAALDAPREAGE